MLELYTQLYKIHLVTAISLMVRVCLVSVVSVFTIIISDRVNDEHTNRVMSTPRLSVHNSGSIVAKHI